MLQHIGFALAGQSQNQMDAHGQPASGGGAYGALGSGKIMPTVDTLQSAVQRTLHAVFQQDKTALLQLHQPVQQFLAYTVGTRPDYQSPHTLHTKGLFIQGHEVVKGAVRVGIGLKIGQIVHLRVLPREELLPGFQLCRDTVGLPAEIGMKGLVVAISTASPPHLSVPVGTGETGIDGQLLYFSGEIFRQKF